jgi:uncharacterized Zn finger protein (UPF0148 family)
VFDAVYHYLEEKVDQETLSGLIYCPLCGCKDKHHNEVHHVKIAIMSLIIQQKYDSKVKIFKEDCSNSTNILELLAFFTTNAENRLHELYTLLCHDIFCPFCGINKKHDNRKHDLHEALEGHLKRHLNISDEVFQKTESEKSSDDKRTFDIGKVMENKNLSGLEFIEKGFDKLALHFLGT